MNACHRSSAVGVLLCAALLAGTPAVAQAAAGCPPEYPEAREMATVFFDGPSFAAEAAALGVSAADTLTMRLLTAPGDSAACERLEALVAMGDVSDYPHVHTFYQVRGYYVIGVGVHPDAESRLNADGTITVAGGRTFGTVVDSAFHIVSSYAF